MMKRVVLFKNGTNVDGKLVIMSPALEELLEISSAKLGIEAKRIFTEKGGEVDDVRLIRDDDVLYVSSGESFIAPNNVLEIPHHSCCSMRFHLPAGHSHHEWITLNVGGQYFTTTRNTLINGAPDSMLARMFAENEGNHLLPSATDQYGAYLIDRNPAYFEPILNFLRHGQLILNKFINPEGVLEEAKFFGIDSLIPILEKMIEIHKAIVHFYDKLKKGRKDVTVISTIIEIAPVNETLPNLNSSLSVLWMDAFSQLKEQPVPANCGPLTRRDVVNALIVTPHAAELRFQGVNLAGADLSRLDLRNINFKFANLQKAKLIGSNLAFCTLERADLSYADLKGANLMGVKMLCANLESAILKSCNFEDPGGNRANMEGVNLKNAILEGSHMAGINLRVATLKNANLQNCDLRGAVLAGADLENCDLSGSDLHEANLRGANLKDAAFELMLTPLHMSQTTIR